MVRYPRSGYGTRMPLAAFVAIAWRPGAAGGAAGARHVKTSRHGPVVHALLACLFAAAAGPALAEAESEGGAPDRTREVVPEFDAYVKLSDQARLFLLADVSRVTPEGVVKGEAGVHFDYTLKPFLRSALADADWARNRYLWVRIGYRWLGSIDGRPDGFRENRVLLEATARHELPQEIWFVHRLRLDLRDVDGKSSRRYRYRLGIERESEVGGTAVVPYGQAEWFYDARYDAWSRQRCLVLAGCSTTYAPTGSAPGCDRNGDREQRVAC
jgi:hypothetical protein